VPWHRQRELGRRIDRGTHGCFPGATHTAMGRGVRTGSSSMAISASPRAGTITIGWRRRCHRQHRAIDGRRCQLEPRLECNSRCRSGLPTCFRSERDLSPNGRGDHRSISAFGAEDTEWDVESTRGNEVVRHVLIAIQRHLYMKTSPNGTTSAGNRAVARRRLVRFDIRV